MTKIDQAAHDKLRWRDRLCGAKAKQNKHKPCRQPAMKNGRCRLHGGYSTGPKTNEGKLRAAQANYKHGLYSKEEKAERKLMRKLTEWNNNGS